MKKIIFMTIVVAAFCQSCLNKTSEPTGVDTAAWQIASQTYSQVVFAASAGEICVAANAWYIATDSTEKDEVVNNYFSNYLIAMPSADTISITGLCNICTYGKSFTDTTWLMIPQNSTSLVALNYKVTSLINDTIQILGVNSSESCAITLKSLKQSSNNYRISGNGVGISLVNSGNITESDFVLPSPLIMNMTSTQVQGGRFAYTTNSGNMTINLYDQTIYLADRQIDVVFTQDNVAVTFMDNTENYKYLTIFTVSDYE